MTPTEQLNQAAVEMAPQLYIGDFSGKQEVIEACVKIITTNPTLVSMAKELDEAVSKLPLVLGHPATSDWCLAVDEHHKATEQERDQLKQQLLDAQTHERDAQKGARINAQVAKLATERNDQLAKRITELEAKIPKESSHFETSSAQES